MVYPANLVNSVYFPVCLSYSYHCLSLTHSFNSILCIYLNNRHFVVRVVTVGRRVQAATSRMPKKKSSRPSQKERNARRSSTTVEGTISYEITKN